MDSNYTYSAKVERVIDGDTIILMVDLGFHVHKRIRARLLDVEAPEKGQDGYQVALLHLTELIHEVTDKDGNITIISHKQGKYGRWLAQIDGVTEKMSQTYPYPKRDTP